MIPTRKFPYTDFHDLNLDWILEKFNSYELDFEDLKRRVAALEEWKIVIDDWKIVIDGDISDIKIKINALKDDTLNLYITSEPGTDVVHFKVGSLTSDDIIIDADFINEIIRRIRNESEFGNNTINVYEYNARPVHEGSKNYRRLNFRIIRVPGTNDKRYLLFETLERYVNTPNYWSGNRLSYFCFRIEYNIDADEKATSVVSVTHLFDYKQNCYVALSSKLLEIKTTDNFISTGDVDYPYKLKVDNPDYTNETSVAVYFRNLNDFKTYSEIISEYVEGDYGCFYIYFKEIPAADFEMEYIIGG